MTNPDNPPPGSSATSTLGNMWWRIATSRGVMVSIVAFNAVLAAIMWAVVVELVHADRLATIRIAVARNDNLATAFEQYVIRTVESADVAVTYLIRENARRGSKLDLIEFVKNYTIRSTALTGVVLADANGNALSTAGPGNTVTRLNISDREYFREHAEHASGRLIVGKPVLGRVSGRMGIPLTRRINKADGSFGGIAVALIEPSRLTDVLHDTRSSSLDLMSVIGLDGITRARLTGTIATSGEDVRKSPLFALQAKSPIGNYFARGALDNVPRYFSYRTLKDSNVIVTVGIAESKVLAEFYDRQSRYFLVAGLVTAMLFFITSLLMVAFAEQRRGTALIVRSQARFLATFNQAAVGIAHSRLDGTFLDVNQKLCEMLGYSRAEFQTLTVPTITHPDDIAASAQLLKGLLDSPNDTASRQMERRFLHKNGSILWVSVTVSLIRDETGKPDYYASVTQDISERRRMEAALRESEERFRTTLDGLSDGCQLIGFDWHYLYLNDAAASHTRRPNADLLGKTMREAWPEFETSGVFAMLGRSMEERISQNGEFDFVFPDDSREWFEVRSQPVPDGLLVLWIRINERRRAQEVARHFAAIVASTDDAIIAKNLDGIITAWNSAAELMFGYTAAEIVGRSITVLIPEDRADEEPMILTTIKKGEYIRHFETVRRRKDGHLLPVSVTISPIREPTGEIVGASKIARDISARLHVEAVLRTHEEEQRRLARQIEHERTQLLEAQEVAKVGSWETTLPDLSVTWSAQTYRIFEIDPTAFQPTHRRFLELVHADDRKKVDDAFVASLATETASAIEHRIVMPDGRIKVVEERWKTFLDDGGRPVRAAGTTQDITERKRIELSLQDYARRLQSISRQLITVQENERRLLARELHDTVGQELTALNLNLSLIRSAIPAEHLGKAGAYLDDSQDLLKDTTRQLRNIMVELRPVGLDELGLIAALKEHGQREALRSNFQLTVVGDEPNPRFNSATEIALFRIVQEALNNIAKHAQANEIIIEFQETPNLARLTVTDDGRGFDTARKPLIGPNGMGLTTMRERAEAIGGHCSITSVPGKGTVISVELSRMSQQLPHVASEN